MWVQVKTSSYWENLNAHSALWGYEKDDDRGQLVIIQMNAKHLIVVNYPYSKPTIETTYSKGWPDISLASFKIFPKIKSWMGESWCIQYGDHR